jgi:hypothetical protein
MRIPTPKVLGHSSTSTTQRYPYLANDPVRAAADRVAGDIAAAMTRRQGGEVVAFQRSRECSGAAS